MKHKFKANLSKTFPVIMCLNMMHVCRTVKNVRW